MINRGLEELCYGLPTVCKVALDMALLRSGIPNGSQNKLRFLVEQNMLDQMLLKSLEEAFDPDQAGTPC